MPTQKGEDYVSHVRRMSSEELLRVARPEDLRRLLDDLSTEFGSTFAEAFTRGLTREQALEKLWRQVFKEDQAIYFRDKMLPFMPPNYREELSRTPCATAWIPDLNAWTIRDPSGGVGVLMSHSMCGFLGDFCASTAGIVYEILGEREEETTAAVHIAAGHLATLIAKAYLRLNVKAELERRFPADYVYQVVNDWGNIQNSYILAHELGHVVLGHLRDNQISLGSIAGVVDPVERFKADPQHEFEADDFAYDAVCQPPQIPDESAGIFFQPPSARILAVDILFSCLDFVAFVTENLLGLPNPHSSDNSHPPAIDRRSRLRSYSNIADSPVYETATMTEKVVDWFKQIYRNEQNARQFQDSIADSKKDTAQ